MFEYKNDTIYTIDEFILNTSNDNINWPTFFGLESLSDIQKTQLNYLLNEVRFLNRSDKSLFYIKPVSLYYVIIVRIYNNLIGSKVASERNILLKIFNLINIQDVILDINKNYSSIFNLIKDLTYIDFEAEFCALISLNYSNGIKSTISNLNDNDLLSLLTKIDRDRKINNIVS